MKRPCRGFTLIELLVALAIFAVISVLSLRAVSAALDSRAHIEAEDRKWRELERLFVTLDTDLTATLVGAGISFTGNALPAAEDGVWLTFARTGRGEDDASAFAPRGVIYRLADGHIERSTYHALRSPGTDAPMSVSRFPSEVRTLSLRYLSKRAGWLSGWNNTDGMAPRALEVNIVLASSEQVRRVFLVR